MPSRREDLQRRQWRAGPVAQAHLAVRGLDDKAMMTGWGVIEGIWLEEAIKRQFADAHTLHLHVDCAHDLAPAIAVCARAAPIKRSHIRYSFRDHVWPNADTRDRHAV